MLEVVVVEWDNIEVGLARVGLKQCPNPNASHLSSDLEAPECQGSFPSQARHSPLHQIPPGPIVKEISFQYGIGPPV